MKVVLDTNVLVSGIFFGGPPLKVLEAWRRRAIRIAVSPEILEEYRRVGNELASRFSGIDMSPFLLLLASNAEICHPREPTPRICEDPDDDMFLACAVAGRCGFVVSGDRHLLKVSGFRGIEVIRPRRFVDEYL